MSKLSGTIDLQERLAIAERAIADAAARINELTQALGEIARAPEGDDISQKAISIGADTVSPFCIGFYQREYDPADRPYRWTGRGNLFELRFRINRSFGWDFSVALQPNPHVNIGGLRGYVDYLEIPLDISISDAIVRGAIPPRPFGRQAVLTFLLPNLFVPNQINPESADTRTLGLVFYELRAIATILNDERTLTPLGAGFPESGSSGATASTFLHEAHRDGFLRKARSSLSASVARPKKLL
jgi:hypothetical protein